MQSTITAQHGRTYATRPVDERKSLHFADAWAQPLPVLLVTEHERVSRDRAANLHNEVGIVWSYFDVVSGRLSNHDREPRSRDPRSSPHRPGQPGSVRETPQGKPCGMTMPAESWCPRKRSTPPRRRYQEPHRIRPHPQPSLRIATGGSQLSGKLGAARGLRVGASARAGARCTSRTSRLSSIVSRGRAVPATPPGPDPSARSATG